MSKPTPTSQPSTQVRAADVMRRSHKLRSESAQIRDRLQALRESLPKDRHARLAALNLIEDAVEARNSERRSVEALRQSEQRLGLALKAAEMGTFLWHVAEDRSECDARLLSLAGLPPDGELNFRTALEAVIHPDDRARYAENAARACDPDGGGVLREDIRVKLPDGSLRWLAISAQTYFEGNPRRATRMVGTAIDISARKRTEDALRASEADQAFLLRLSDALRTLADPLEVQAVASRVLGEHLQASRVLYAKVEQCEDSDYYVICQDYHAPEVPPLVGRHRANDFGATLFNEMRAGRTLAVMDVTVEDRITEEERQAYPVLGIRAYIGVPLIKQGRHVAIFAVLQTTARVWTAAEIALVEQMAERTWSAVERAQAEAALREAKAAADLANRSKDHFLAVLSHELRTPLTPVMMLVSALLEDKSLPKDLLDDLTMIRRNVEVETRLIDELLDLTRLNSGKISLNLQELDVNEIMGHVCEICRPQSIERHIQVSTQFDPQLRKFKADPVRLQQVFWNVLKNAIKFTMVHGRITITTSQLTDGGCEVRVQDNGIGMKPEMLDRIFDVFEQGDPAITQQFGGLGLGLAITKVLVELHGGRIRAESEGVGKGTCVVMELPN